MKTFFGRIIKDHYQSLPVPVSVLCHLVPLLVIVPIRGGFNPTEGQLSAVISAVSIYSALLFGILVPASDQARRIKEEIAKQPDDNSIVSKQQLKTLRNHHKVAKDILASVAYSILVSLLAVLCLTICLCLRPKEGGPITDSYQASLYVSAYLFMFVLTLLLVVVRTAYGSLVEEAS